MEEEQGQVTEGEGPRLDRRAKNGVEWVKTWPEEEKKVWQGS